jgi:RND superfamily putative drug exporter
VVELARRFTPAGTVPALVVYERGGGVTTADRAKVAEDVRRFAGIDGIGGQVVGPTLASDGAAFQVVVPIRVGSNGSDTTTPAVRQLRAIARDGDGGLRAYVTGPAGYAAAFDDVLEGIDSTLLYITAAIVIVILLLTYRSPALWLLPVICVAVALTTAQAVIYLLARHAGLVVNDLSAFILTVLVFGAGTDYALLLIARYREELRRTATGTRPWPRRCVAPDPRPSPAPPP